MKTVWWILGIVLIVVGTVGIIALLGAVFSHQEGFTSLGGPVWGYIAFHTVSTCLGLFCIDRATKAKRAAAGVTLPSGERMMELSNIFEQVISPLAILAVWFVLMRYVLPRLGVSTGLGRNCHVEFPRQESDDITPEEQS